jgi:hypothetical protein
MVCECGQRQESGKGTGMTGSTDDCRCRSESRRRTIVTVSREALRDFIILPYLSFWFEDLVWKILGSVILRTFRYW